MKQAPKMEKGVEPSAEQLQIDVQQLKEWLEKEPHLPNVTDDDWLMMFLYHNKFSIEKTKAKLDKYFSLRNKHSHILKGRDPLSAANLEDDCRAFQAFVSKELTKDGSRLLLLQFDPDPSFFDMPRLIRRMSMCLDTLILEKDKLHSYIFITDCRNLHYKHFLKALLEIQAAAEIFNDAYTERVEQIHVINAPSFIDAILDKIMIFFPKKYADRLFVHTATKNNIMEMVDENAVPTDFGGKGLSAAGCEEWTRKQLAKYREWFIEHENISSNEALRSTSKDQLEEMKGSFRKLEVD